MEGGGVLFGGEVAALPAPIGPAAGEAIEHLLGGALAADALGFGQGGERGVVGDGAPQEGGDGLFLDLLQRGGHAGFAEILLRQHVGGDLRPEVGHFDVVETEHDGAIGIPDLAGGQPELNPGVG